MVRQALNPLFKGGRRCFRRHPQVICHEDFSLVGITTRRLAKCGGTIAGTAAAYNRKFDTGNLIPTRIFSWAVSCQISRTPSDKGGAGRILGNDQKEAAQPSTPPPSASPLEKAECFRAVTDQQIFCLLIMVEHHLVCFTTDA